MAARTALLPLRNPVAESVINDGVVTVRKNSSQLTRGRRPVMEKYSFGLLKQNPPSHYMRSGDARDRVPQTLQYSTLDLEMDCCVRIFPTLSDLTHTTACKQMT